MRNLDPADPLWVGDEPPSPDHPTGITHRHTLTMDWSHGHNNTIHNGISRIGFYTGGMKARFRDQDLADEWVRAADQWIDANQKRPFFLYLASHDIHCPRTPHERFVGKSGMGPRGDAIVEFDWQVGELMKSLESRGLAENTLVVVCSDNGPVLDDGYKDQAVELLGSHQPSGIYRGGKYSVFEGGTRTPFITWWKGRIQPGVSDQVVCTIDFAASFAALAGQPIPDANACRDSLNVLDALLGKPGAKGRDHLVQQENNGTSFGFREGDWKLIRHGGRKKADGTQLYHLAKDPGEKTDVSAGHPDVLARMQARLDKIIADGRTRTLE